MPLRLRKLIGMFLLVGLVTVYCVVTVTVAEIRLAQSPWWVHLTFFGIGGVLWVLPAMFIIKWMERPVKKETD